MWRRVRTDFFTGLFAIIPFFVTAWALYFIINKLNSLLLEPIMNILSQWLPGQNVEGLTKIAIFIVLVLLLILVGFATRSIIMRNIFGFGEKILYRVPLVSAIYGGMKEISLAFLGKKQSIFIKVVLVEYPRKGIYSMGFVTSEAQSEIQKKTKQDVITIFMPTTPNPATGVFIIAPKQDVINLDMSVVDGMKMVISGGAFAPKADYGYTENRSDTFEKEGLQGN